MHYLLVVSIVVKTGHQLQTSQVTTENDSVEEFADHGTL